MQQKRETRRELVSEPNRTNEIQSNRTKGYLENRKTKNMTILIIGTQKQQVTPKKGTKLN